MKKTIKTNIHGERLSHKRLLVADSILNISPTIIGFFLWIGMTCLGIRWIDENFGFQSIEGLMIIVWCIVISLPLTRIIPAPTMVYEVLE